MLKTQQEPNFSGSDYQPDRDKDRLMGQLQSIFDCMEDGKFRSLGEIEVITGAPQASISAQLRNLRKEQFGSHTINKQYTGNGLYLYQLVVNRKGDPLQC